MIISAIITFTILIISTIIVIRLYDWFDNDLVQGIIIIAYGMFVIYTVFNFLVDSAFNLSL
ncbi:hypothetical protein [Virgibacillus salexigens]|uniref:hypothetical protein n=1 Tax=Virgibacillus massiliensis TaxID=1462526 RepID=UPI00136F04A9|nr:hypothetical protein [Virgibacillus massiliensis]MYL43992.1 hypothetical protein [Virgibacillus massiliensis]